MANGDIKITIEQGLHELLKVVANEYADKYGIYITDVSFDWQYMQIGKKAKVLHKVTVSTESN